jgi:hypothetical protein
MSSAPPDNVRCTRELDAELLTFGKIKGRSAIIHRTVRCASGATTTSSATVDYNAFNVRLCAQRSEHAQLAHQTVYRRCPVHNRTAQRPHKSELQRSNPNGWLTWLAHRTVSSGAPDCPVCHATTSFQRPHFGGWGYKYPQPPHIQLYPSFYTSTPYKSYSIQYKTHQRDQILSQLYTKL